MSEGKTEMTEQNPSPGQGPQPSDLQRERVSSLLDGELETSSVLTTLDALKRDQGLRQALREYSLISDVMRDIQPKAISLDFSARVAEAIRQEPVYLQTAAQRQESSSADLLSSAILSREGRRRGRALTAIAASLGALGLVSAALVMSLEQTSGPSSFVVAPSESGSRQSASWEDPRTRSLMDAHGTMAVKLRLAEEQ